MTSHKGGLVAAGNQMTAEAAATILGEGGNAFDAMIAALFMACVSEPVLCSLGGGGFAMAKENGKAPELLDFFAQTSLAKRPVDALDFEAITADFGTVHQEFHTGLGSVATPGFVAGLFAMHDRFATLPISALASPAIELAKSGHLLDPFQAYVLDVVSPIMLRTPEAAKLYASRKEADGVGTQVMKAGELIRNPDLANTIEYLCTDGSNLFYKGALAECITRDQKDKGHLTRNDLEAYQVEWRKPLKANFGGASLFTNPAPSSGGTLLALQLKLLDAAPKEVFWPLALVEAMATTNRLRHESGFANDPSDEAVGRLFDELHIAEFRTALAGRAEKVGGTTHISIVDRLGNVASVTTSNGEGCGHIVPGTGVMLNNMLGEEDIHPKGFFKWDCNTRISSMMAPSILMQADGSLSAFGSGGSNRIRTALFQVAANMVFKGMDEAHAITAPRLHYEHGLLHIEGGFEAEIIESLKKACDPCHLWDSQNLFFGGVHMATILGRELTGAADPRRGGAVLRV